MRIRDLFGALWLLAGAGTSLALEPPTGKPPVRNYLMAEYQGHLNNWVVRQGPDQRIYVGGGDGQVNTYDSSPGLFGQMFGGGDSNGSRQPTTVNTAQVDGSTGFISSLGDRLGSILGAIGSTGDGPAQPQQVPVGYRGASTGGGLDGATILGVLAVAGVVYVLSTQSN